MGGFVTSGRPFFRWRGFFCYGSFMSTTEYILVGNSFPLTLIRRAVQMVPVALSDFHRAIAGRSVLTFWGHENTLAQAEAFCGTSLKPQCKRPVLQLQEEGFPVLNGVTFNEAWVVSPEYAKSFRPFPGAETPAEEIVGWTILKLTWE